MKEPWYFAFAMISSGLGMLALVAFICVKIWLILS